MKTQLLKKGRVVLPIFLAMVLVTAGVIGISGAANAAAKGTTYTVTLGDGSVGKTAISMSGSPAIEMESTMSGSFQMIVDAKGGFVIPKKTLQLTQKMGGIAAGYVSTITLKKDVKGKLGTGGTVTGVLNAKKLSVKMGKKGPAGSLTAVMDFETVTKGPDGSVLKLKAQYTFTTSNATITGKGTKGSGLEGKSMSGTGAPLDLNAGTGKLVGIGGSMKMKSAGGGEVQAGLRDEMGFMTLVWGTTAAPGTAAPGSTPGAIHTGLDASSPFGKLLDNPQTRAILDKYIGKILTQYAGMINEKIRGEVASAILVRLKAVGITDDQIKSITEELAAIK